MKCPNCSFKNISDSKFCQRCGYEIGKNRQTKIDKIYQKNTSDTKIDDVIFKPKKKQNVVLRIIKLVLISGVVFTALVVAVLIFIPSEDSDYVPLDSQIQNVFPVSYLSLEEADIKFISDEAYLVGILHNKYSKAARNVVVRVDFFKDKASQKKFDTRRVSIEYGAEANGAFSFQIPLNIYPEGQFWWVWTIEGADNEL